MPGNVSAWPRTQSVVLPSLTVGVEGDVGMRHLRVRAARAVGVLLCTTVAACGGSPEPVPSATPTTDGKLVVGALLPRTGDAAHLRAPQLAGIRLAAADINASGGVLGQRLQVLEADIGDRRNGVAKASVDSLLASDIDAAVVGGSSSVTVDVLPQLVGGEVLTVSSSNTAAELSGLPDQGLYFRTAPVDAAQGAALGDLVVQNENTSLRILASDDPYGRALAESANRAAQAGGVDVAPPIVVGPGPEGAADAVRQVEEANPDAIAVLMSSGGEAVLAELHGSGLGGTKKRLYLSDALLSTYPDLPAGALRGAQAVRPGAPPAPDQRAELVGQFEELTDAAFALEAYDAVVLTALAAVAAGSDEGPAMAAKMRGLTRGGTVCPDFAECARYLTADPNADIAYEGLSGPLDFDPQGNRTVATFGTYIYNAGNTFRLNRSVQRRHP